MRDRRIVPYNLGLKATARTLRREHLEVLRFTNAEVIGNLEGVCTRIRQTLAEKT